jgi:hypothetical protein
MPQHQDDKSRHHWVPEFNVSQKWSAWPMNEQLNQQPSEAAQFDKTCPTRAGLTLSSIKWFSPVVSKCNWKSGDHTSKNRKYKYGRVGGILLIGALKMIIEMGLLGLLVFAVLVVIGLLIIVFVIGSLIAFLPATIIAIVVLLLTGSWFYAGIAFLIIAALMILFRK